MGKTKKKSKLRQVEKEKLLGEKKQIIKKIILRNNKAVYETYLDLKRLIEINEDLTGRRDIFELSEQINMSDRNIRYFLGLEKLENKEWNERIDIRIILYVLNFNEETRENQNKIFEESEKMGLNLEKLKYKLYKEYSTSNPDIIIQKPRILYERLTRDLKRINKNFNLYQMVEFQEGEKFVINDLLKELLGRVKDLKFVDDTEIKNKLDDTNEDTDDDIDEMGLDN